LRPCTFYGAGKLTLEQVAKDDKALQDKLPRVMQDALKKKTTSSAPKGSRSYSTTTTPISGGGDVDMGIVSFTTPATAPVVPGAKFELPSLPLPQGSHVKRRYDAVIDQVTNLLMRHGQKSVAQRVWSSL
jgi:small subunit ribosomal protein S7